MAHGGNLKKMATQNLLFELSYEPLTWITLKINVVPVVDFRRLNKTFSMKSMPDEIMHVS